MRVLIGSFLLFLAACSNGQRDLGVFGGALQNLGIGRQTAPAATFDQLRQALTPEVRARYGNAAVLLARQPSRNLSAVLFQNGENRGVKTFQTVDGVTVSLDSGVVVATRGFGFDLMVADLGEVLPALRNGHGRATRIHRYLDGEDQIVIRSFICEIGQGRSGVTETCYSEGLSFENQYVFAGGQMRASKQWISPENGYLYFEADR